MGEGGTEIYADSNSFIRSIARRGLELSASGGLDVRLDSPLPWVARPALGVSDLDPAGDS